MSIILGVDLGTVMGFAEIKNGKLIKHTYITLLGDYWMTKVAYLYNYLDRFMSIIKPDLVMIEEPPMVRNVKGYAKLSQLEAAVWLACEQEGVPYAEEQNKTLKKWFTGNGNAKKVDIMETALDRYGLKRKIFETAKEAELWENAYDAIMIVSYGEWFFERMEDDNGQGE